MAGELLIQRHRIQFGEAENASFVPLGAEVPDRLKTPLIRTKTGIIPGYLSGYRSGLIRNEGELFKLKGCRPEGTIHGTGEPTGSQQFSLAQYEAEKVTEAREVFLEEGIEYPIEPVGYYIYDNFRFNNEPNAATIYRAKGDTRLDEFLSLLHAIPVDFVNRPELEYITLIGEIVGLSVGRTLRIFHDHGFCWDNPHDIETTNAHSGNIVIFKGTDSIANFGIMDFDGTTRYGKPSETKDMKATQERDLSRFLGRLNRLVTSSSRERIIPIDPSYKLILDFIKKNMSDIPSEHHVAVASYVRHSLSQNYQGNRHETIMTMSPPLGQMTSHAVIEGYSRNFKFPELAWEDLIHVKTLSKTLRKEFVENVASLFGYANDPAKIVAEAQKLIKDRPQLSLFAELSLK